MKKINYTTRTAEMLLILIIMARSTSFVAAKIGLRDMDVYTLLGLRFLLAFLILLPITWKKLKVSDINSVKHGAILGFAFFLVMAAEVKGLSQTGSSTVALLENNAIVFVPIFEAFILRRLPSKKTAISILLASVGVIFVTLSGQQMNFGLGEAMAMIAAVLYAVTIILTDRISRLGNPIAIGVYQVGFIGLFSMIMAFIYETPRLPQTNTEWQVIIILAIICTGLGFTLQPLAQSKTSSERAGLFCAVTPSSAAILGWIFLGESFGMVGIIGIILIIGSVFIKEKKIA